MKKILLILLLATKLTAFGQTKDSTPKDTTRSTTEIFYTVQFSEKALAVLYEILSQSDYSHKQVEALKTYIGSQLKKQLPRTSK